MKYKWRKEPKLTKAKKRAIEDQKKKTRREYFEPVTVAFWNSPNTIPDLRQIVLCKTRFADGFLASDKYLIKQNRREEEELRRRYWQNTVDNNKIIGWRYFFDIVEYNDKLNELMP